MSSISQSFGLFRPFLEEAKNLPPFIFKGTYSPFEKHLYTIQNKRKTAQISRKGPRVIQVEATALLV